MCSLMLHIDGSSVRGSGERKKDFVLGWGLVAHYAGGHAELQGAVTVPQALNAYHELLAFVEAALFAHARGYQPEDVVIHTDDEIVGYAPWALHPENYQALRANSLRERVRKLTTALYSEAVYELTMQFLQRARIQKLLGHSFLIDQERADYLAKQCAWNKFGKTSGAPQSLEDWLRSGLPVSKRGGAKARIKVAPFVAREFA